MILTLFDVDGTLISSDGAGMRAFRYAMRDVYDINIDLIETGAIRPDGKTDPLILKEILAHFPSKGQRPEALQARMFAHYLEGLEKEMVQAQALGRVLVLPGVKGLLERLSSERDFAVGLATGNLEKGARIKLENAGLYEYFHFGGFGSDSEDRTILTQIGIQRGTRHVAPAAVEGVFVIGDTPFDVEHGRAAGAGVIAVASGAYTIADLGACNPDLVLSDLLPAESIISFMRNGARTAASRQ